MFAKISSMGVYGINAFRVTVEADVRNGLPKFNIVGLPDTTVNESRVRVRSAAANSKLSFPSSAVSINLAPADVKKEGSTYDLPILMAILAATNQIGKAIEGCIFLGELSLSGELRKVRGVLPMLIEAQRLGYREAFIPFENAAEGAVVDNLNVYPVKNVSELIGHIRKTSPLKKVTLDDFNAEETDWDIDFSEVRGQDMAKRCFEIAAAGGHNLLMIGAPGSGKSMLAKRLTTILPDMTRDEAIQTTTIHSIAGVLPNGVPLITKRPFRAPHHTTSAISLSGGGTIPHPGEVSMAHNGVLFLDELPEFQRLALEALRQPIEDGHITVSRVAGSVTYPCTIMLVAAMNPCPCGYFGSRTHECICSHRAVTNYINRVSGPLLDRLDIQIEIQPVDFEKLSASAPGESSAEIRSRVNAARRLQHLRLVGSPSSCNAVMNESQLRRFCVCTDAAMATLRLVYDKLGLSARGHNRILRLARTIADLDHSELITEAHISEAIMYRSLDRKYWK